MTYYIIAYPAGSRTVVSEFSGLSRNSESMVKFAAMANEASSGSEADGAVIKARTQANVRGEYVELFRNDQHIATVGPEGVV